MRKKVAIAEGNTYNSVYNSLYLLKNEFSTSLLKSNSKYILIKPNLVSGENNGLPSSNIQSVKALMDFIN